MLAAHMAAHPIGDDVQGQLLVHQERVLVAVALQPDVGDADGFDSHSVSLPGALDATAGRAERGRTGKPSPGITHLQTK